jgi:hypothetical protein
MYLLYADESGDTGLVNSPSKYFCLSGLVLHELRWHDTLDQIIQFRRLLRSKYGLKLREEIHAAHLIHRPNSLSRIPKSLRLQLLRDIIDFQATIPDISILNILVKKDGKPIGTDIFEMAWTTLAQRFHNTISYKNFPGPQNPDDKGMLIVDQTDEVKLRNLSRRMRRYNPVPKAYGGGYFSMPATTVVEDSVHRNSLHSYFVQLADVNAYFLYQMYDPCSYVKRKGARNYFRRLMPVLCTVASRSNPEGVVER